jgi:cytochrome c oxidase subunit 2
MFDTFPLWPERASTTAGSVDALFIFLVALSALMSAAIFTMIVGFAIRYRRCRGVVAEQIEGSTALEITWSAIPFCIFMVIFVWGAMIYFTERTPPRAATEI